MFPNPYTLLGGGVLVLAIAGTIYVQSSRIHSWHNKYDCVESGLNCPKGVENIPDLRAKIATMTTAQNEQTGKSEGNVTRVVQIPSQTAPIIKIINETSLPKNCVAPKYPQEVTNAF